MQWIGDNECDFVFYTVMNKSTLHPQTDHLVVTVEGDTSTKMVLDINGKHVEKTIAELLECGMGAQMKPWHSESFLIHTAVPQASYEADYIWHEEPSGERIDSYHVEAEQMNGQWAFFSPCHVVI